MRQLENYLTIGTSWGHVSHQARLPIGLFIVIYYRISPLCQIINQSIRRYIFWHHLSLCFMFEVFKRAKRSGVLFGIIMWRLVWLVNLLVLSRSDIPCDRALQKCRYDKSCLPMLLKIFSHDCTSALGYDPELNRIKGAMRKTCPGTCVAAIRNLTSSSSGKSLESCYCENRDATCLTLKARLKRCVLMNEKGKNYTISGCTKARRRCNHDKDCQKIQNSFLRRCTALISGLNCTQDCKNSQDDLLRSDLGKALNDCECDGLEELYCRGIRANYEELCKGSRGSRGDPDVISTPREKTVKESQRNSSGITQYERLPVWILYAAIIVHVYVLFNR